jgi:hypothetical protein
VVTRYADDDSVTVKRLGLIVDIETTGLDPARDRIIELVCLTFHFSSEGVLYDILPGYAVLAGMSRIERDRFVDQRNTALPLSHQRQAHAELGKDLCIISRHRLSHAGPGL